jgi:hypothetical protein
MSFKNQYYLTETVYKNLYRGFSSNDSTLSLETASKGTATLGPGLYFSTEESEARKYGKYLLTANINFVRTVSEIKSPSPKELEAMINSSPKKDSVLDEFGETKEEAMEKAIETYQEYGNEKDAYIALYNSFYFPIYARQFCLSMVRLGFDGMIVSKKDGSKQFIVYNIKKVQKVSFKESK